MRIKMTYSERAVSMFNSSTIFFVVVFFCMLSLKNFAQQNSGSLKTNGFRASVIEVDISPNSPKQLLGYGARLSTGIHDRIYHRIIALDDGTTQFFLVSSEICEVSPSEYDHVAELLQKKLGINPLNFWWSVTHTHSAPEVGVPGLSEVFLGDRYKHEVDTSYTSFIEQTMINGITEARQKLEPAKLGVGWGFSQANINRRAIEVDGKASIGLNPDGVVDRRIGLMRLEKQDGSPLALIANYPIHGTVLGQDNLEISGDVTGIVSEYVEEKTGAPVLFINGAAGNLAPIYRKNGINMVKLPVRFLKIGNDVAIWSAPLELFCEISNEVRERSPFPFTFYFGYTNGWLGYLPTEEEYKHGGYEVEVVSPYTPVAGRELTETVVAYMQGEMKSVAPDRPKEKKKR